MKKLLYIPALLACLISVTATAQEAPSAKTKTVTFATEKEKSEKIKELEAKIKVDESDPTYPAKELAKEKQQLQELKKAKVNTVK